MTKDENQDNIDFGNSGRSRADAAARTQPLSLMNRILITKQFLQVTISM